MDEVLTTLTGGAIWGAGFAVAFAAVELAAKGVRFAVGKTIDTAGKGASAVTGQAKSLAAGALAGTQDLYAEVKQERVRRA